jgi:predicted ester cyclase
MKRVKLAAVVLVVLTTWCASSAMAQGGPAPSTAPSPAEATANQADAGTQTDTPKAASPSTQPTEAQLADTQPRKYVELWNTGEMGPAMSMFSSPYFMNSRGARLKLSVGMLAGVIRAWRSSMPDLNLKIEDTIIQGDKVAMRLTFTGTYKARLFANTAEPKSAAPNTIKATEMLFFQLRDGKIAEIWQEYDELAMRYRMGGVWRSNAELAGHADQEVPGSGSSPSPKR